MAVGQITGHSDAIRVQHVTEDNAVNFTDYTFSISSLVQGQPDTDTVTVRVLGGTAGNVTEVYEESPIFRMEKPISSSSTSPAWVGLITQPGTTTTSAGSIRGSTRQTATAAMSLPMARCCLWHSSAANHTASVNETFSRDQFLENQRLNLANGFISQAEYDTLIGSMDEYAEVISK